MRPSRLDEPITGEQAERNVGEHVQQEIEREVARAEEDGDGVLARGAQRNERIRLAYPMSRAQTASAPW
jgi:hypothetical protein